MGRSLIENAILGIAFRKDRNGRVTQNEIIKRITAKNALPFLVSPIMVEPVFKSLREQGLIIPDKRSYKLTPKGKRKVANFRKVVVRD